MRWWRWGGAGSLVLVGVVAACTNTRPYGDDDDDDVLCSPGETRACLGPGMCDGAQQCISDGTGWTVCDCGTSTGSGTGTPAGTTTGAGVGTPAGTTTGTGVGTGSPSCQQVDLGMGETQECQDCLGVQCCIQYLTCAGGGDCTALWACGDPNNGDCGTLCYYPVCDTPVGYVFWKTCIDCLSSHCCSQYQACWANSSCQTCLMANFNDATCSQTTLDDQLQTCQSTYCSAPCPS